MGFLIRAFSILNGAREWFSFAGEAVSRMGVAKRAAVATAVVAGGAAVVAPIVHVARQPATVAHQAPAPSSAPDVQEQINKIGAGNAYSKLYLVQPEHLALLEAILEKCKTGNQAAAAQCDVAVAAEKTVQARKRNAAMIAAMRRASARQEQAPDSTIKLPFEQTIVK